MLRGCSAPRSVAISLITELMVAKSSTDSGLVNEMA